MDFNGLNRCFFLPISPIGLIGLVGPIGLIGHQNS